MKKQVLLSAIAGALLIGTVAPSCKKGDTGAPGKDGIGINGKDGKDGINGKDAIPTTPESAEITVRSILGRYNSAKTALGATIDAILKGGEKALVSNDEVKKEIEAIDKWVSEDDKSKAIELANKKIAAVKVLLSYKGSVGKNGSINNATLDGEASATSIKELYDAYVEEANLIVNAGKSIESQFAFGEKTAVNKTARKKYAEEIKSFDCISKDPLSATLTVSDVISKYEEQLTTANNLVSKKVTAVVNTLASQKSKATTAAKLKLTNELGEHVEANTAVDNGVSKERKEMIVELFEAKGDLIKQVNYALKHFAKDLDLDKMGINAALAKELGL